MGIPDDLGRIERNCRICLTELNRTVDPTFPATRCRKFSSCRMDHCCVECCKHDAGSGEIWDDKKLRDVLCIGDHVMHRGTKEWGTIKIIDLRLDGTAELILLSSPGSHYYPKDAFWATYHLGAIEIDDNDPRLMRLARSLKIYRPHEAGGKWPAPPKRDAPTSSGVRLPCQGPYDDDRKCTLENPCPAHSR